jgi:hypothetical protein
MFDPKFEDIVEKLVAGNIVAGSAVGYERIKPEQYKLFEKLKEWASTKDLEKLLNHDSPIIQCYAFWALTETIGYDFFPVLMANLGNNKKVKTFFYCIMSTGTVAGFFVGLSIDKLTESQKHILDKKILTENYDVFRKSTILGNLELSEKNYEIIRKYVLEFKNDDAIVSLARFQKEEDIDIILSFEKKPINYFFAAIENFPHPRFLPILEKYLPIYLADKHYNPPEMRSFYRAIASYKNEKALTMLNSVFTSVKHENIRKYQIEFVSKAVTEYQCPLYDTILFKLWESENQINLEVFNYLLERDFKRSYDMTLHTLQKIYDFHFNHFLEQDEKLIEKMIDLILEKDRETAIKVIDKNLLEANVSVFEIFTNKSSILKEETLIDSLFKVMEIDGNPHIYLAAVNAIFAVNNESLNQKVIETWKKVPHLREGWGGEKFRELLIEKKLKIN